MSRPCRAQGFVVGIAGVLRARRMHSRARLRKVSGLIRIASGPGKDRRVLRQNSAAISASLGFSATLGRVAAERLSAALP